MPSIVRIILIAFVAGAVGTTVGGVLGIVVKKPKKNYIGCMLAFAAGAMLGMSLFEMLPEAYEHGSELFAHGGLVAVLSGLVLGALFFLGFWLIKKRQETKQQAKLLDCSLPANGMTQSECAAANEKRKLFSIGIIVFIAIILHDLPEGIAIGAGYHVELAVVLGVVMLLHNIPEGLAIAVPLKASGVSNVKIIALSFAAGFPSVFGAVIGYYLGMHDALIAYTLAFAAGVMLFIVFAEMLPTAYEYGGKHHVTTLFILLGTVLIVVFSSFLH